MKLKQKHAKRLHWMAEDSDKTEAQVLAEILDEYFADMDRDAELARKVLRRSKRSFSFDEVMRRHGLDHPL